MQYLAYTIAYSLSQFEMEEFSGGGGGTNAPSPLPKSQMNVNPIEVCELIT